MSDLILELDPSQGRAAAVEAALRRVLASGRLDTGARLPSTRALARELGLARATVVAAYEQLIAEGHLVATVGSGTVVARAGRDAAAGGDPSAADPRARVYTGLLPGEPDAAAFPRAGWSAAMRQVLRTAPDELFGYGDPRGLPELRTVLASYLARSRAVVADPARIVVFSGFAAALSVLAETFRGLGVTSVGFEDPCLPPHARTVGAGGPDIVPIAVDGEGLVVEELGDVAAVVCTPAHQYPMGVVLSPARRVALVEHARRAGTWVVEDDYDGEFRYDRRAIGALQGLAPDRVIYGGTASKSLAPGLALAWLVLPAPLVGAVAETARARRAVVSTLEQAALAEFIASGRLDRHVRARRLAYRHRRDAVVRTLTERAPWLEVTGVSAGLHVTALLRDRSEGEIIDIARRRHTALFGVRNHCLGSPRAEGLVIGYSRPPAHAFNDALARLTAVLDDC